MPLTNEEMVGIDKLLSRMEKAAKAWGWARWLILGCGLGGMAMAVWMLALAQECLKIPASPETGRVVSSMDLISERFTAIGFSVLYTITIFMIGLSISSLGYALSRWNKGTTDALLVKLVRSYIDGQRPITDKAERLQDK